MKELTLVNIMWLIISITGYFVISVDDSGQVYNERSVRVGFYTECLFKACYTISNTIPIH